MTPGARKSSQREDQSTEPIEDAMMSLKSARVGGARFKRSRDVAQRDGRALREVGGLPLRQMGRQVRLFVGTVRCTTRRRDKKCSEVEALLWLKDDGRA